MTELLARYALWIAVAVFAVLILVQSKVNPQRLGERLTEIALQAAAVFLAVSLAFQQTDYDRKQQRLQEVQAIAVSGSMSLSLALQELAYVLANGYDLALSESWFAVPSLVEKMASDEKMLGTMGLESSGRLTDYVARLKRSYQSAQHYAGPKRPKEMSWDKSSCELNRIVADHLAAASGVFQEVRALLTKTGQPIPDFLTSSGITVPGQPHDETVFLVARGRILPNPQAKSFSQENLTQIRAFMDKEVRSCERDFRDD